MAKLLAHDFAKKVRGVLDGWTWSVDQVPITIKSLALAVGKYVSRVGNVYIYIYYVALPPQQALFERYPP